MYCSLFVCVEKGNTLHRYLNIQNDVCIGRKHMALMAEVTWVSNPCYNSLYSGLLRVRQLGHLEVCVPLVSNNPTVLNWMKTILIRQYVFYLYTYLPLKIFRAAKMVLPKVSHPGIYYTYLVFTMWKQQILPDHLFSLLYTDKEYTVQYIISFILLDFILFAYLANLVFPFSLSQDPSNPINCVVQHCKHGNLFHLAIGS